MASRIAETSPIVVVMGVSGSGKTTLGRALAVHLRWRFQDGDAFHSAANIAKMRAGVPLDDADRAPWLAAIADWMDQRIRAHGAALIGCSALKRKYRDGLRQGRPQVWFLYLRVVRPELERRIAARQHPYLPTSLLDSQLETLEEPTSDERCCLVLNAGQSLDSNLEQALQLLHAAGVIRPAPQVSD